MTELGFLLDLLLEHKLPAPTRKAITARIKEVELDLVSRPASAPRVPLHTAIANGAVPIPPHLVGQSPSTIAAMMRHEANGAVPALPVPQAQAAEPAPVVAVAQTPQAAAAMVARQEAIAVGISGKPVKGETRPRKW